MEQLAGQHRMIHDHASSSAPADDPALQAFQLGCGWHNALTDEEQQEGYKLWW
jgi:hypothetical protein